jgi:hypothetical protein
MEDYFEEVYESVPLTGRNGGAYAETFKNMSFEN